MKKKEVKKSEKKKKNLHIIYNNFGVYMFKNDEKGILNNIIRRSADISPVNLATNQYVFSLF